MTQSPPATSRNDSGAKGRFIRRMFDTIAPDYDRLNSWVSLGMDRFWRRRAVRHMPSEGWIADWCAGTGDMAAEYFRQGNKGRVVMCDFSTEMRRLSDAKIPADAKSRCFYVCCDVTRTPFRDGVFDGQMQGFAIRNLMNRAAFFKEAFRSSTKGGRGALLDLSVPASAIWRAICHLHFRVIAPRIVALVARRGVFAYRYLSESVEHHAVPQQITEEMTQAVFPDVRHRSLMGGIGAIFMWGKRPEQNSLGT